MTEPLIITFDVDCTSDHAFETWTSRIGSWWPRDHTVSGRAADVVLQPGVGGRIFEGGPDGIEHAWGVVTAWEPPVRMSCRWHIGRSSDEPTEVEIRFTATGSNTTRVEIEQRGWERFGTEAGPWRERNRAGWDTVVPHFRAAVGRDR